MTRNAIESDVALVQLEAAQEVLRVSERRYRAAFETSLDAMAICRIADGIFVDVNRQFHTILGYERGELVGQTSEEVYTWVDSDGQYHSGEFIDVSGRSSHELCIWENPQDWARLIASLHGESMCRNLEGRLRRKDGNLIWAVISASVLELEGVPCILLVARDVSAAKATEDEIRILTSQDGLTQLPNRRHLLELLDCHHNQIAGHVSSALLLINLDHFRAINESRGSLIGDLLLKEVSRRISGCVNDGDTVARARGDEFGVILERPISAKEEAAEQAMIIARRILAVLQLPYILKGHDCHCTASIGITILENSELNAEDILQQCDIAVQHAKAAGRGTIRFFAPALQVAINARTKMTSDLRAAVEKQELELYYQPQMRDGELVGAEALVRWNHPKRGLMLPGKFIPLAEETDLILPIGTWVLGAAFRQVAKWAASRKFANLRVAVNISARQFRQPEFVGNILDTLRRTGANPRNIELELTESTLVSDVEEVIARMSELRTYGLRFSVDDFGVGYSSMSYLQRLPLDQLKIDMSFVQEILNAPGSKAIAQAIISLARALDLDVIAEGVESEEQRLCLAQLGCNFCQGYLFGRPVPASQFESEMGIVSTTIIG